MNKIIFQVILVVVSVGLFFTIADPMYRSEDVQKPGIKKLKEEIQKYDDALTKSNELIADKKRLTEKSNNISQTNRQNLERLLPDSIDNIRLLIDIDSIALRYGLILKEVRFTESSARGSSEVAASDSLAIGGNDVIGTVTFGFSISTRYETFKAFLQSLEQSLRLIDITDIKVSASGDKDVYDYSLTMKTYWLR